MRQNAPSRAVMPARETMEPPFEGQSETLAPDVVQASIRSSE